MKGADAAPPAKSPPRRRRWLHASRPRLLAAIAVGIAGAVLAPVGAALRPVIGWDIGIVCYLVLILIEATQTNPARMHRQAQLEDPARWVFLVLMAGAAWFSMFALLGILHRARAASGHLSVELALLAGATILLSWVFAHTAFAIHYARDYYADLAARRPAALLFPGDRGDPDYWDFLYFSFVVGMTCQVSDVQVATRFWRRLVLAHGIVSFLFNTVVLALSINILAGQL